MALLSKEKFIISRLWRGQKVIIPLSSTVLRKDDQLLVVTEKNNEESLTLLFGERLKTDWNSSDVDWNHIDAKIGSRILVVSRKVLNGKRLGELQLRNTYGVNVSRVFRGDMKPAGHRRFAPAIRRPRHGGGHAPLARTRGEPSLAMPSRRSTNPRWAASFWDWSWACSSAAYLSSYQAWKCP